MNRDPQERSRTVCAQYAVDQDDSALSLQIKDRALGDTGAHFGSRRLLGNHNHSEFYLAVIEAITEHKKSSAAVVLNGAEY